MDDIVQTTKEQIIKSGNDITEESFFLVYGSMSVHSGSDSPSSSVESPALVVKNINKFIFKPSKNA